MGSPGAIIPVAGNITFQWTAIGNNLAEILPDQAPLLDNRYGNAFSADNLTWMQPSTNQSAQTLKTLTSQPNLITDPPGLRISPLDPQTSWRILLTPLLGDASTPGVLIDAIPDANSTNKLINPVTGKEILKDVFGNPRNDGTQRDIGAVQVGDAATLSLVPNDTCAILSWTQGQDPVGNSVAGYLITYGPLSFLPTILNLSDATTTRTNICNLTEGVTYEFGVKAYYISGETAPPSNVVTMTAYGPFLAPTIFSSNTPTASTIFVNWTQPMLGGRQLLGYAYIFYPKDLSGPAQVVASMANGAAIPGLRPATLYTVCIAAEATNNNLVSGSKSVVGNCIDISTGPVCDTFAAAIKARRRVRCGSKFTMSITLRQRKGVSFVEAVGINVSWPNGVTMTPLSMRRLSRYGTAKSTSGGVTVTGIVLRTKKLRMNIPLQVHSCATSSIGLTLTTFRQLNESYGFNYCARDVAPWVMFCKQ